MWVLGMEVGASARELLTSQSSEKESHRTALTDLELAMELRLASNSKTSACLCLPRVGLKECATMSSSFLLLFGTGSLFAALAVLN